MVTGLVGNPATIDPPLDRSKGTDALETRALLAEEGNEPVDNDIEPIPDSKRATVPVSGGFVV